MKVPGGTLEYQQSIRKSKEYLKRLKKGKMMLEKAIKEKEFIEAQDIIRLWDKLASEVFVELETATLIHQQLLTGSKVLIKSDGTVVGIEEIMNSDVQEVDPWTLLSLEKLKSVFGDDIDKYLEIKEEFNS